MSSSLASELSLLLFYRHKTSTCLSFSIQFLAMVFQDLLTNKDDYLRASRALLREIIKQTKHEINFQSFCLGLMQERKEASYADMEFKVSIFHIVGLLECRLGRPFLDCSAFFDPLTFIHYYSHVWSEIGFLHVYFFFPCMQERFVIQVTDLLTVSMMLGITAQVKESGIAWDKGEKKSKWLFV